MPDGSDIPWLQAGGGNEPVKVNVDLLLFKSLSLRGIERLESHGQDLVRIAAATTPRIPTLTAALDWTAEFDELTKLLKSIAARAEEPFEASFSTEDRRAGRDALLVDMRRAHSALICLGLELSDAEMHRT